MDLIQWLLPLHSVWFILSSGSAYFSGPAPFQFPSPSGEVKDLPCVAFPWYSSAGVGSGPRELIGVKVETLDTHPSRQTAVEPRHGQPGLFGWHTIPTSAKEV